MFYFERNKIEKYYFERIVQDIENIEIKALLFNLDAVHFTYTLIILLKRKLFENSSVYHSYLNLIFLFCSYFKHVQNKNIYGMLG